MKTTKLLGIVIFTAAIIAATTMLTTSGTRPALAKGNCSTADDGSLTCSGGTSYKHDKGVDIPGEANISRLHRTEV